MCIQQDKWEKTRWKQDPAKGYYLNPVGLNLRDTLKPQAHYPVHQEPPLPPMWEGQRTSSCLLHARDSKLRGWMWWLGWRKELRGGGGRGRKGEEGPSTVAQWERNKRTLRIAFLLHFLNISNWINFFIF